MRGPLVSVLIPSFNSGKTIASALFSVVNQNYNSLEIIVVDDGSTDDTERVVFEFKDKRIKYEKLETNSGITVALNRAIKLASGGIIARMDADDVMLPWRLSDQVPWMLENNLTILGGGAEKFGAAHGRMISPEKGPDVINSFLINNPFIHPAVIINRNHVDVYYREDFLCEEDYELWSRLITASNCENISHPVIKYRVAQTTNQNRLDKQKFTKIVLTQFCDRLGVENVPIEALLEIQLSGFIRYEDYLAIKDYACDSARTGQPGLGWLQKELVRSRSYKDFTNWYLRCIGQTRYFA